MEIAVAYGAAPDATAKACARIAILVDASGKVKEVWDPAGTADFPAQALAKC